MEAQYITITEIMTTLGVSRPCATELVYREIPHLRVGRAIRIRRDAWEKWLKTREVKDTPVNVMRRWNAAHKVG